MAFRMGRLLLLAVPLLSGCGIGATVNARTEMEKSKADYKACLAKNADDIEACDAAYLAYEADVKSYRALTSGYNSVNVNTSGD